MKSLLINEELQEALTEITSPHMSWQDLAVIYLRGGVAEFWSNNAKDVKGVKLDMNMFRARTRAFMREGDSLTVAIQKARQ